MRCVPEAMLGTLCACHVISKVSYVISGPRGGGGSLPSEYKQGSLNLILNEMFRDLSFYINIINPSLSTFYYQPLPVYILLLTLPGIHFVSNRSLKICGNLSRSLRVPP